MRHMVGVAAQKDFPTAVDHRLLAAGAATLAGMAAVAGVHEHPVRGVGPAVGVEEDGVAEGSVAEVSVVEG